MKNISIIMQSSLAARLFLRTPLFGLLQESPYIITVYTYPKVKFSKKFKAFRNVRVRNIKYLFRLKQSDIVLVDTWDETIVRGIVEKVRRWKILVLFVQEGMGNPVGGYSTDFYPDKLAVWGEVAKELYIERRTSENKIVVTGQPRFDWYYGFKKKKIFDTDKKVLLYTTQPLWRSPGLFPDSEEILRSQFDILCEAAARFDLQLVCKMHPSDRKDLYGRDSVMIMDETGTSSDRYIKGYNSTGYDPEKADMIRLGEILSAADIVVTIFSTTALEAMMLGTPVIFFDIADCLSRTEINRILKRKAGFCVADNSEVLFELIEKYLKNPQADKEKRERVVYNFAYKQDGCASKRVFDLMKSML